MRKRIILTVVLILVATLALTGCSVPDVAAYTIPQIDLSEKLVRLPGEDVNISEEDIAKYSYLFNESTVVDNSTNYIAHPDSILLKEKALGASEFVYTDDILTMFPLGHGKGALKAKISTDGGKTYKEENTLKNTPKTWENSQETPTLYRLDFKEEKNKDKPDRLVMIAGNPYWPSSNGQSYERNGFNVSYSDPTQLDDGTWVEGREWTEFETFWGKDAFGWWESFKAYDAIVAMSSLTQLKDENGNWVDQWMGLFHDHSFNCYKTILTFDENDKMQWSKPEKYFSDYRQIQFKSQMCEVECVRSDGGEGDTLAIITRSNSKKMNSMVSFSEDEGKTWSEPKELPSAISGERHKAEWIQYNGEWKLFITFRSIERNKANLASFAPGLTTGWFSEGWVAWVGDFDDLKNGTEGDFRVKLAHTYLSSEQTGPARSANADTGYCGNVVLTDGTIVTCSYGKFTQGSDDTYILSKRVRIEDLFALANAYGK